MQKPLTSTAKGNNHGITSLPWHKLTRFYFIVSSFCIGISVLAICSTMLISHHNLHKDELQMTSIVHLLRSVDWWNDYQAHKVKEKIYNMELDNLNISLHEDLYPDIYKRQAFAKYLFLDKEQHDDLHDYDSLTNLMNKAKFHEGVYENLTKDDIPKNSKFIINYEFITILLIVAASLAGISEIAKNKLLGYSAFCVGGIGCVLLVLAVTIGITLPLSEKGNVDNYVQPMQPHPNVARQPIFKSTSSNDFNHMYDYCRVNATSIIQIDTKGCVLLFRK
ncbi:MAG TPA: DUF4337 family protein [Nitrososphaeraceae archaeon]|jgi:hypothetical protein